jgi:hypothetical protein
LNKKRRRNEIKETRQMRDRKEYGKQGSEVEREREWWKEKE